MFPQKVLRSQKWKVLRCGNSQLQLELITMINWTIISMAYATINRSETKKNYWSDQLLFSPTEKKTNFKSNLVLKLFSNPSGVLNSPVNRNSHINKKLRVDHTLQAGWANQSVVMPEKASYRDNVVKFQCKKRKNWLDCVGKKFDFHALKILKFYQIFISGFCFVTKSFQVSPDFQNLVAHFTIWQHCCWTLLNTVFQCLVNRLFHIFLT